MGLGGGGGLKKRAGTSLQNMQMTKYQTYLLVWIYSCPRGPPEPCQYQANKLMYIICKTLGQYAFKTQF